MDLFTVGKSKGHRDRTLERREGLSEKTLAAAIGLDLSCKLRVSAGKENGENQNLIVISVHAAQLQKLQDN